ncbi:MAG: Hydroxymethylpyrimidine phosphate kinase ThiD, partial [uncultured Gemmatimonadaceae bacterium]
AHRSHHRRLRLGRRRRHPGRPQDVPPVRRLRHLGGHRDHRAEHARGHR